MTALLLFITVALIAVNAFFVMGEYALVRSRRSRLEALKDEGDREFAKMMKPVLDAAVQITPGLESPTELDGLVP